MSGPYKWLEGEKVQDSIAVRIPPPDGYERLDAPPGSFGKWLRNLPLKPGKPAVFLHDGIRKYNQNAHFAVVDIDVGRKDLQQCADAAMRLRAEYLYSLDAYPAIHFNFTSGDNCPFSQWMEGYRPSINGNKVTWKQNGATGSSYSSFRNHLNTVFMYAGTASLSKELKAVSSPENIAAGNVFIQGGFPGHAVIVGDIAVHKNSGKKIFLLAQSYMPAQDIHILKNPSNKTLSPWFETEFGEKLITPEWTFKKKHLMRFVDNQSSQL